MGKIVGRRIFIDPHYIEEFEEWLTGMAGKGLMFDHMDKKKCYFEKTEPKEIEYRVVINSFLLTPEKVREFEEAGYGYIAALKDFRKKQCRDGAISIGIMILLIILLYFLCNHTVAIATFLIASTIVSVPMCFLLILQAIYLLQNIVGTTRRIHLLKEKEEIKYLAKWNNRKLLHRGTQIIGASLILLAVIFNVIPLYSIFLILS